jgi:nucleoside-diphosphate-sugar epimerase
VASWLTVIGTRGASTCDFVRSTVVTTANTGTEPLEKILNPFGEGLQLIGRTTRSLARRVCGGGSYPGLSESIAAFHHAVATGGPPPLSPSHLLTVTSVFERLASRIEGAAHPSSSRRNPPAHATSHVTGAKNDSRAHDLVVVTGASGFLGSAIAAALPRVRGIGRRGLPGEGTQEWVVSDLAEGLRPEAIAGASVVIHAAAATSGGAHEHQRNSLDATRHLLRAMHQASVRRLVLFSSLSVLNPPATPWERQHEGTPRCLHPERLGPYTWGKTRQEEGVEREAAALGIETVVIRPGALIDLADPALPGLVGRRLFGKWHLGLGRPALPIAVCDVVTCARAIAWCAQHFDEAPRIVNLFDPAITTRKSLIARCRRAGWNGRMLWVPIPALAAAITVARTAGALLTTGHLPERLDAWALLRPRRFRADASAALLAAVEQTAHSK